MYGHSNDRKWKIQVFIFNLLTTLRFENYPFQTIFQYITNSFSSKKWKTFRFRLPKNLVKESGDILDKFDFGGQLYQICPIFRIGKWFDVGGWCSESLSPQLLFLEQKRCQKINLQKKLLFWGKKRLSLPLNCWLKTKMADFDLFFCLTRN